jgi:hypothetical protein
MEPKGVELSLLENELEKARVHFRRWDDLGNRLRRNLEEHRSIQKRIREDGVRELEMLIEHVKNSH